VGKKGNGKISQEDLDALEIIESEDASILSSKRASRIAHVSSSMGFAPRTQHDAFTVGYSKEYAMPGGSRVARATAQFDKGIAGLEHAKLQSFVISVTAYIPADPDSVRQYAPEIMRDDLLNYIEQLGGMDTDAPASLVMIQCDSCKKPTPEYIKHRKERLCRPCYTRKMGGAPV
jgi:hypothetical protein